MNQKMCKWWLKSVYTKLSNGEKVRSYFFTVNRTYCHYSPVLTQHVQEVRQSNFHTSYFLLTIQNEILVLLEKQGSETMPQFGFKWRKYLKFLVLKICY